LVAALNEALSDKDVFIQILAALALWNIGARVDSNVVTMLVGALNDTYVTVRQAATNALLKIDPEAAAKAGVQ
jgi:hypothetical protein